MKIELYLLLSICMTASLLYGETTNETELHRVETEAARVSSNLVVRLTEVPGNARKTGDTVAIEDVLKPFDEMTEGGMPFRPMSLEAALLAYAERGDAERRDLLLFALTGLVERTEAVQMETFRAVTTVWIGDPVMGEGVENARNKRVADGLDDIVPFVASFAVNDRLDIGVRREAAAFLAQLVADDPASDGAFVSASRILQKRLSRTRSVGNGDEQVRPRPVFEWSVPVRAKTNGTIRICASVRTNSVPVPTIAAPPKANEKGMQ